MKLYEPAARLYHVSFLVEGKLYLWGGETQDVAFGDQEKIVELARRIEQFDPYLEVWSQLNTAGAPHPGLRYAACASHGEHVYMYGGAATKVESALSCLNFGVKTPTWSQLCLVETVGGPMRKSSCGMVHFHDDKLAVIGGYGYTNGPIQPGSVFIRNPRATDGFGWTNEIHIFDISQGSDSC
jgi:N-acetylneuraminic acid mutarotase